jgi:predicted MFS family arabinose efflux permease
VRETSVDGADDRGGSGTGMIAAMGPRAEGIARRLFGAGPFGRLVVVHSITNAADALFAVSLAGSLFFSVSADAARPRILLYLLLTLAPFAVLGPFIAPVIDRAPGGYRFVILLTSTGRFLACLAMTASLNSLLFFPEAFIVLVLGRTYSVAKSSLVARLVDDDTHLVAANAQLARMGTIGGVIGGVAGAALLHLRSPATTVAAAAIAHALALVVGWRLPHRTVPHEQDPVLDEAEIHQTRLTFAATSMGVLRSAVGFATFLIALVLKSNAEPAWVYGLALLVGGIAGFAATLIAGPLRRHLDEQAILLSCLGLGGLISFVAVAAPNKAAVAALAAAVALAATTGRQAFDSLTQRLAPDAEKGRAFAGFEWRFELAWVLGAIIPVTFKPALPIGLVAIGSVLLAAAAVYAFGLRELRGGQLVVALGGPDHDERLAASLLAVARAATSHGAPRMAVALAHEAASVSLAEHGCRETPAGMAELTLLWQRAAAGQPLDGETAERATDLAAGIIALASRSPEARRSG